MHPLALPIATLSVLTAFISFHINQIVPSPYLDEVFHIPQAQAYCNNTFFPYNDKLTTPPGLYILSYPLSFLTNCSIPLLRSLNTVGVAIVLPIILYPLLRYRGHSREIAAHIAFNISIFPVILFFAGLYYTDVWSTIFVLLTWSAGVRGKKLQAAILGWVSLWFRQTNVVWVGMAAGMSVVEALGPQTRDPILAPAGGRGATFADFVVNTPFTILVRAVMHPGLLVNGLGPYVFPLASFGGFLVFNGYTIVLGDHSAHTASVNTPQLLYFTVFTLFFSFPLFLPLLPSLPRLIQRPSTIISFVLATFLAGIAVKVNTILHPFLLADNRHYVFYIFRRILLRWGWYSTVAVAPIYVLSGWFMGMSVLRPIAAAASGIKGVRVSTIILYSFSTAAVTVTAGLVEPRYFIIPWILWRVHAIHLPPSPPSLEKKLPKGIINYLAQRKTVLWMETLWFLFINFITVWVFLYRGFEWGSEMGKVQRFMW